MSVSFSGLDKLQRTLSELQAMMSGLDGEIAKLKIDPNDPDSVSAAIRDMERAVDAKMAPYRGNAMAENIATRSKEVFREAIQKRVAAARS